MTITNFFGELSHETDVWLRSFSGVLAWKGTVALAIILGAGSLWNVCLAELDEKGLHDIAGARLRKEADEATDDDKIQEWEIKASTLGLKASSRVWSAVSLSLGALAYFLKPNGC